MPDRVPDRVPVKASLPVSLLLRLSGRYLLKHPWQIGLALLGVALGVGMLVAVELATSSARIAFQHSTDQVTGRTTHQVVGGPAGIDTLLAEDLRQSIQPPPALTPVLETPVGGWKKEQDPTLPPARRLTLLGVEPSSIGAFRPQLGPGQGGKVTVLGALIGREGIVTLDEKALSELTGQMPAGNVSEGNQEKTPTKLPFPPAGGVVLSAALARELQVQPGDTLRIRPGATARDVLVLATLEPPDSASAEALSSLVIAELGTVQGWLDRFGEADRLDLILPEGPELARLEATLRENLPPGATLTRPALRSQALQQLTAAFEVNLQALSFLALIVGMFLIYNTITFSVVQRRGLIGILRCLGLTRREIFWQVVLEALLIGVLGTLLGMGLGIWLGRGLVGLVSQTINDLYFAVTVQDVYISPQALSKGVLLGVVATLLTAMIPALEATRTPPRMALRRSSYEEKVQKILPVASVTGLLLLVASVLLLPYTKGPIELSFVALMCGILGAAALTPLVTVLAMALLRPLLGITLGLLGRMAARDVVASLSRTSIAIAALMIAVSVTIGIGLMVGSFRQTVVDWLEYTLQADIYVSIPGAVNTRSELPIPAEVEAMLRARPELERVRTHRRLSVELPEGPLDVIGAVIPLEVDRRAYRLAKGNFVDAWKGFDEGGVLITEPLAFRTGLGPGDTLTLPTAEGPKTFPVAGVYYDYASDRGLVTLRQDLAQQLWQVEGVTAMGLYVKPGVEVERLVQALRQQVPSDTVATIQSMRSLRDGSMQIFDRTFAITYVLQLLSTIVAFIGILSALMALQLERARELAVLRANGLTPRQVWGVVLTQTGLMGLLAGLLAVPVGVATAWMLVYVINQRSFGWSMPLTLEPRLLVEAVTGAVLAALLAGLYPAWKMSRTPPALALRDE